MCVLGVPSREIRSWATLTLQQEDTPQQQDFIWLQVSFVGCGSGENEKIAFNYGRELFVYPYRGIRKSSEAKLLDKRVYKVRQTVPSALEAQ
jgi:hypothetical protein